MIIHSNIYLPIFFISVHLYTHYIIYVLFGKTYLTGGHVFLENISYLNIYLLSGIQSCGRSRGKGIKID